MIGALFLFSGLERAGPSFISAPKFDQLYRAGQLGGLVREPSQIDLVAPTLSLDSKCVCMIGRQVGYMDGSRAPLW
eukprot:COSAG01_NODE_52769_length_344_cov_0.844898_1_plen_76_part_00